MGKRSDLRAFPVLSLIFFLTAFGLAATGCLSPEPDLRAAADRALAEGDLTGAIGALGAMHDRAPDDPEILFELGTVYYELGRAQIDAPELGDNPGLAFDESAHYFGRALELAPTHQGAGLLLAEALFMNGDLDGARSAAGDCCRRWPDLGRAHELAGKIALSRAQQADQAEAGPVLADAIASLERAVLLDPSLAPAHVSLGDSLLQKGEIGQAAEAYMNGVAHCPEANDLHGRLILLNGVENGTNPDLAIAFYSAQLEDPARLSPQAAGRLWWFKGSWHGYAGIELYGKNDFEAAAEVYGEQIVCLQQSVTACAEFEADGVAEGAKVRLNRGWCLIRLERFDEAQEDVFACLDVFPDEQNLILAVDTLGYEISQKKGYAAALEFFDALTARHGGRHQWWNDYGFFSLETNMASAGPPEKYSKTLSIYMKALELEPDYPRYLNDAAMLIDYYLDPERERRDEVEAMYRSAWILGREAWSSPFRDAAEKEVMFSAFTDALVNLARLCIEGDRRDEARAFVDEILNVAPGRPEALLFRRILDEGLELQELYQPPSRKK